MMSFTQDGVEKRVLNAADTEAAKDKLDKIKAAFETWVWKGVERADRLARIYKTASTTSSRGISTGRT